MPGGLTLLASTPANIATPSSGKVTIFFNSDNNLPSYKDSTGAVYPMGTTGAQGVPGFIFGGDGGDSFSDGGIILPTPNVSNISVPRNGVNTISFQDTFTDIGSVSLKIGATDSVKFEVFGDLFNNTGGDRAYSLGFVIGSKTLSIAGNANISTANICAIMGKAYAIVRSASVLRFFGEGKVTLANADGTTIADVILGCWTFSASDFTGVQTCKVQIKANASGSGNTFTGGFTITHLIGGVG